MPALLLLWDGPVDALRNDIELAKSASEAINLGPSGRYFCIGVLLTVLIAFLAGAVPEHYYVAHLAIYTLLLPLQIRSKTKLRQFWTMMDFTWVFSAATYVYLWLAFLSSESVASAQVFGGLYCLAFGIVGWEAFWLQLPMVFHDSGMMSALMVHLMPMLTYWCIRWNANSLHNWAAFLSGCPGRHRIQVLGVTFYEEAAAPPVAAAPGERCASTASAAAEVLDGLTWWELYSFAMGGYLLWLILNTMWMLLHGMHLHEHQQMTMFSAYLEQDSRSRRGRLHKWLGVIGDGGSEVRRLFLFQGIHLLLALITVAVSAVCFRFWYLGSAMMLGGFFFAVYNGARWYSRQLAHISRVILTMRYEDREKARAGYGAIP
eukprot:TRINITY_DN62380_c0_g1_i1.p1 TRINITY_DN62380_c0_g1~~TRINITY_DN62380_c0_g1_i1.p1  ORF type:complete len:375 (+),score=84.41 TRINITY_DN62380_c0_g1_i1:90-1214(+)